MKTPRFTDLDRYPHVYTRSVATDVAKTFARVLREQAQAEASKASKVTPIKERKKS